MNAVRIAALISGTCQIYVYGRYYGLSRRYNELLARYAETKEDAIRLNKLSSHLAHMIDENGIELTEFDKIVISEIVNSKP